MGLFTDWAQKAGNKLGTSLIKGSLFKDIEEGKEAVKEAGTKFAEQKAEPTMTEDNKATNALVDEGKLPQEQLEIFPQQEQSEWTSHGEQKAQMDEPPMKSMDIQDGAPKNPSLYAAIREELKDDETEYSDTQLQKMFDSVNEEEQARLMEKATQTKKKSLADYLQPYKDFSSGLKEKGATYKELEEEWDYLQQKSPLLSADVPAGRISGTQYNMLVERQEALKREFIRRRSGWDWLPELDTQRDWSKDLPPLEELIPEPAIVMTPGIKDVAREQLATRKIKDPFSGKMFTPKYSDQDLEKFWKDVPREEQEKYVKMGEKRDEENRKAAEKSTQLLLDMATIVLPEGDLKNIAQAGIKEAAGALVKQVGQPKPYTEAELRRETSLLLLEKHGVGIVKHDDSFLDYAWKNSLSSEEKQGIINKITTEKNEAVEKAQTLFENNQTFIGMMEDLYGKRYVQDWEQRATDRMISGEIATGGVGTALDSATLNIASTMYEKYIKDPYEVDIAPKDLLAYQQSKGTREEAQWKIDVSKGVGSFVGAAVPYSGIAGQITKGIRGIKAMKAVKGTKLYATQQALAEHPVFTAYVIQGGLEEAVDASIRKGTGQRYTAEDFMWGIGFNTVFTRLGLGGKIEGTEAMAKIDTALQKAEAEKGAKLTTPEANEVMMGTELYKGKTAGDLFGLAQEKFAYKTGMPGDMPPKPGEFPSQKKPSVTEEGVTKPAPLPEVDSPAIKKAQADIEEAKVLREDAPEEAPFDSGTKTKADYDKYIKETQAYIDSKTPAVKEPAPRIKERVEQKIEEKELERGELQDRAIAKAESEDYAVREQISEFNTRQLDRMRRVRKAFDTQKKFQEGDVETMRASDFETKIREKVGDNDIVRTTKISEDLHKSLEAMGEKYPGIDEGEAYLRILDIPTKADVVSARAGVTRAMRETKEPMKKTRESTQLKQRLKAIESGIREGKITTKQQIKKVQGFLVDALKKSDLTLKDRGKFLATVKNIQTPKQLVKQVKDIQVRMSALVESEAVRSTLKKVQKELKTSKVKKVSGKPKGKFGATAQEVLDDMGMASKMTRAEAQEKIMENLEPYLKTGENVPNGVLLKNQVLDKFADIKSMDSKQLKNMLEVLKDTKGEGRMLQELKAFNRQTEIQRVTEKIEEVITGGKGLKAGIETMGIKEVEGIEAFLRTSGKNLMGWDDVLDMLSQLDKTSKAGKSALSKFGDVHDAMMKEEKIKRIFTEKMNEGLQKAYGLDEKAGLKKLTEDTKPEVLGTFTNADGIKVELEFSKSELRYRWGELQNKNYWRMEEIDGKMTRVGDLALNNKYTEEIANAIDAKMTAKDKAFVESQWKIYDEMYDEINAVFKESYGVNLPKREKYLPTQREGVARDHSMGTDALLQSVTTKGSVAKGFLQSQVVNKHSIKKQSDVQALQMHLEEAAHFVAWKEKVRDLDAVLGDGRIQSAIKQEYGTGTLKVVDNFLRRFTTNGADTAGTIEILDKIRLNYTRSVLALKPKVFITQIMSFPAYMENISTKEFADGVKDWADPRKWKMIRETLGESEMMKARGMSMERDIKAAFESDAFKAYRKNPSWKNKMMFLTQLGDKGAIYLGGWSHYKAKKAQFIKKGISEAEAHKAALRDFEKVTLKAQQSGYVADQSVWQSSGSIGKLTSMFHSSQNLYFRKELNAIRGLMSGRMDKKQVLKKLAIYHLILPNIYQATINAAQGEIDWKEQLRASIIGSLNGVFIMGELMDKVTRLALELPTYGDTVTSPVMQTLNDLPEMYNQIYKIVADDEITEEDFDRAVEGLLGTTGDLLGVPAKTAYRFTKTGLIDNIIKEGEYAAGIATMAGWSPYMTENLKTGPEAKAKKALKESKDEVKEETQELKDSVKDKLKEMEGMTDAEKTKVLQSFTKEEKKMVKKVLKKEAQLAETDTEKTIRKIKNAKIAERPAAYQALLDGLIADGRKEDAAKVLKDMSKSEVKAYKKYLANKS